MMACGLSFGLAVAGILGISGCGQSRTSFQEMDSGNGEKGETQKKAMGRFLEEDVNVPEGCQAISDMKFMEDGTLQILYWGNQGVFLAESSDQGQTWEKIVNLSTKVNLREKEQLSGGGAAALAKDGGVFVTSMEEEGEDYRTHYYYISPVGEATELKLEELIGDGYMFSCSFSEEGTLLFTASDGIKEVNISDGSLKASYEDGNFVSLFYVEEKRLIAVIGDDIHYYDLETGKPLDDGEVLTEQITKDPGNIEMLGIGYSPILLLPGDEENSLFYVVHDGMYRYAFGGNVVEKMIDGSLNSLNSPDTNFSSFARDDQGRFYVAAVDYSQTDTGQGKIYRYVYSQDTPAVPDTELTVYSLTEDSYLRQVAAVFQKKYPDIYLNLETGMTGEDAVTDTDALKSLNTEIMAGKGPDVLLLDQIPGETYVEKGMLKDLSGILKDADILENIRSAYTREDGSIYEMPVKFAIPVLFGREDFMREEEDIMVLADAIESHTDLYTENTLPLVESFSPYVLLKALCVPSVNTWVTEAHTLDTDAIREYYEQLDRIYQSSRQQAEKCLTQYGADEEQLETMAKEYDAQGAALYEYSLSSMAILSGNACVTAGGLFSPDGLAIMDSVEQTVNGVNYALWKGQEEENCFTPVKIVGISAKTNKTEAAEKFVRFLFEEEGQKTGQSSGIPVKKSVYESMDYWKVGNEDGLVSTTTSYNAATGEEFCLDIRCPDEKNIQKVINLGEKLTKPVNYNRMIVDGVTKAGVRYLNGEITLEEAVKDAQAQVNLYLSE